jgi:hypothetical protein
MITNQNRFHGQSNRHGQISRRLFSLRQERHWNCGFVIGATGARKLATSARSFLLFGIDTPSKFLPQHFWRPNVGRAKQHPTLHIPQISSPSRLKQKEIVMKTEAQNINDDPLRAGLLFQLARNKGSFSSCSPPDGCYPDSQRPKAALPFKTLPRALETQELVGVRSFQ